MAAARQKPIRGGSIFLETSSNVGPPTRRADLQGGDMQKEDKERVVADLTDKLRQAETLFVADYRGLTMPQIDARGGRLREGGGGLSVAKNTLPRRAAEAAGAEALRALLEGPPAIALTGAAYH